MTEVALRTFVAAPCQCTRLMFGLAISQTLHIPPFFMDFLSSFYYNKVREYNPCGLYGRHLWLVGSPRHGWVFHVHVVLVQHPVYVALSPIAGTLHYLLHAVASLIHIDDQLIPLQFLVVVLVGIQLCFQVIMRVAVTLGKDLTNQVERVRRLLLREEQVVSVQFVMQRNDADLHL